MSLIPPWTTSTSAPVGARLQPLGDPVGALAVDTAVAEAKARVLSRRPVLPLALLVELVADLGAHLGVGIPVRRARVDRVAERGDDDRALPVPCPDLASLGAAAAGGCQRDENVYVDVQLARDG